jgi:lipoprotein-anchoring transpeptidase ErfK/SrfK
VHRRKEVVTILQTIGVGILAAGFATCAAACGGETGSAPAPPGAAPRVQPATVTTPVRRRPACRTGSFRRLGSDRIAYAAAVLRSARAYRAPGSRPFARFGKRNVNGAQTIFGVLGRTVDARCRTRWYEAQLPLKPNGATGWVRARDVAIGKVRTRLVVDLSARNLTFFRNGRPLLRTVTAIGSSATPTPTGRYYVDQRLIPTDTAGPFGPGAIGISAFSEVLTGWVQGGPIAIHGTNAPWSIGQAVSNGCIRVRNTVLRRLFAATPAGTPVIIRA